MVCDFTFRHYEEIIQKALDAGYEFYSFSDYLDKKPSGKSFLLRHDIDNHYYRAKEFAKIENKLGVKATYFYRIHTNYNLFEYNNFKDLRFVDETHEVGLHCEIGDFDKMNPGIGLDELLRRGKAYLEAILGHEIVGVAPHRDIDYQVNTLPILEEINFKDFGFKYQSYQKEFHGDAKYIAETLSPHISWRDGCPCNHIGKEEKICLMTHPAWWFYEHPREGEE